MSILSGFEYFNVRWGYLDSISITKSTINGKKMAHNGLKLLLKLHFHSPYIQEYTVYNILSKVMTKGMTQNNFFKNPDQGFREVSHDCSTILLETMI